MAHAEPAAAVGDAEADIVAGLRAGDRRAWLRLYDRHAPPLWRHVARLVGNDPHAADDVMQATMLAAAASAQNFDPRRGTLWMWLYGIARRQAALYLRTRRREKRAVVAVDTAAVADWLADLEAPPPPVSLESRETADAVRAALAELADDDAFVLVAAYMEQMTMNQVAALLGKSFEATRSQAARARRHFRETFVRLAGRDASPAKDAAPNAAPNAARSTDHVA